MEKAYVVAGLGYGDEGKGHIVDALCREHNADLVVRYTGGPQASHTVVLSDGREHRFSQFGSGTFLPNCRTHISNHVLVEPFAMMNEAAALEKVGVTDAMDRMSVDPDCYLITPWHWMANRLIEASRRDRKHGSCGMGIGETKRMIVEDCLGITVGDLGRRPAHDRLRAIRNAQISRVDQFIDVRYGVSWRHLFFEESIADLADFYNDWSSRISIKSGIFGLSDRPVVFEGAQGVLLDETYGCPPHNTWANTTFDNAIEICRESDLEPVKIGVLRTYATRHGAGPFLTQSPEVDFPDHNTENQWQGPFRQGYFDLEASRYAIRVCGGIDALALTCLDRVGTEGWLYQDGIRVLSRTTKDSVIPFLERELGVPIHYRSYGPNELNVRIGDKECD